MRRSPSARRTLATTSCEVGPTGLSTISRPSITYPRGYAPRTPPHALSRARSQSAGLRSGGHSSFARAILVPPEGLRLGLRPASDTADAPLIVASVSTKPDPVFDAFAAREPYFAVVTDPRFLRANLTAAHEREFFATGEALVNRLFAIIDAGLAPGFAPVSMLEYGCGLGRLAIPLSRRPGSVTAIDRSPVMLDLARREAVRRGVGHIAFETPDAFQATSRKFDLVICYHVLQRLPRHHG